MSRPAADSTRAIARNTALLAAAQGIGSGSRIAYVIVVARLLGPELYALLAYVQSWYLAFLPLAMAGLGPALVQRLAGGGERLRQTASAALGLRLAATAVAAVACAALALAVVPDRRAPALIAVLLLALAGRAITAWAQHLFIARDLNRHTLRQEAAFRIVEVLAAIGVLLAGGGVLALVLVHVVAWLVQAAAALRVVAREINPVRAILPRDEVRALGALAAPFFALQLLAEWRIHGPLVLYRNVVTDAALFGQFALAMQAMLIAAALPQALGAAAQPALARSAAAGDGRDLAFASIVHRLAFAGGTAAGLLGLALGPPLFAALFGAAYATAGRLVGLTLWCLVPLTAGFAYPLVFTLRGEMRSQILQSAVATLTAAALVPALGLRLGASGAVLGAAVAFAIPPLVSALSAARRGHDSWSHLVAGPVLAATLPLGLYLLLEPRSVPLALGAALGALALLLAGLRVVRPSDVGLLRGLVRGADPA